MNRWSDKHPSLSMRLDLLKDIDESQRTEIIKQVMNLVEQYDNSLLNSENAFDFPLNINKRRWYDEDPYLWAMFNTLKAADNTLLYKIENYLTTTLH